MLADELLKRATDEHKDFAAELGRSKKFFIEHELLSELDVFIRDESFYDAMREKARLPFPEVFLEFHPRSLDGSGFRKLGCLCTENKTGHISVRYLSDKGYTKWVFWFNPKTFAYNNGSPQVEITMTDEAERASREQDITAIGKYALILGSVLTALNSPTIIEKKEKDFTDWNKKRVKRGQHPLSNHISVNLKREIIDALAAQNAPLVDPNDKSPKKLHWRRGHFKHRKTGTFWWSPHLAGRGDTAQDKTYIVEKTA